MRLPSSGCNICFDTPAIQHVHSVMSTGIAKHQQPPALYMSLFVSQHVHTLTERVYHNAVVFSAAQVLHLHI